MQPEKLDCVDNSLTRHYIIFFFFLNMTAKFSLIFRSQFYCVVWKRERKERTYPIAWFGTLSWGCVWKLIKKFFFYNIFSYKNMNLFFKHMIRTKTLSYIPTIEVHNTKCWHIEYYFGEENWRPFNENWLGLLR